MAPWGRLRLKKIWLSSRVVRLEMQRIFPLAALDEAQSFFMLISGTNKVFTYY